MKKEAYFTADTLCLQAEAMLADMARARRKHSPGAYNPPDSALLVLDMQAYFLSAASHAFIPSGPAILPGVVSLCQAYHARALPVFFSRHANTPDDAGMMTRWWQDMLRPDTPESEIVPALASYAVETIHKTRYDAFFNTRLEARLRARQVSQVVICGVMTHLCCETTARSAFMHGFEVFFTIDGTATYTETFHRAALLNLAHGFAVPVLVDEILAGLNAN